MRTTELQIEPYNNEDEYDRIKPEDNDIKPEDINIKPALWSLGRQMENENTKKFSPPKIVKHSNKRLPAIADNPNSSTMEQSKYFHQKRMSVSPKKHLGLNDNRTMNISLETEEDRLLPPIVPVFVIKKLESR